MDKATPIPSPASVDSVMALYDIAEEAARLDGHAMAGPSEKARIRKLRDLVRAEVERLAAQAAPTDTEALRHLMGMGEAEIDAELLASGINPDDAVKRADRAIKGVLATIRAERRAIEYGDIVHKQVIAMRAAVVAAKLESPEVGIQWIENTLFGPGHYPDIEAAREMGGAQALFDKEVTEHEAFRVAHPAPVAAQPSQAPVVQAVQATQAVRMLTDDEQAAKTGGDVEGIFRASTVAALKAQVAELEKDAARLEFVCNSPNRMVERESGLWRVYEDVAPTDHPTAVWQGMTPRWHVTPREAIDAAITAALTKGQP